MVNAFQLWVKGGEFAGGILAHRRNPKGRLKLSGMKMRTTALLRSEHLEPVVVDEPMQLGHTVLDLRGRGLGEPRGRERFDGQ